MAILKLLYCSSDPLSARAITTLLEQIYGMKTKYLLTYPTLKTLLRTGLVEKVKKGYWSFWNISEYGKEVYKRRMKL